MVDISEIHIGTDFDLSAEAFTKTIAIMAKKGAGKSYTAGVIEEEFAAGGLPFVVMDPVGVHWSIRAMADGSPAPWSVVVFGGEHADIEIERDSGAKVARVILEEKLSAVVDVSQLSKSAWREFVRDFARTLYETNRPADGRGHPIHLFIEEATEFVPQRFRPDMAETYEAVERLVRLGRNRGIGVSLISQRPAQVNKDVLTQIDILIALHTVGPQDIRAFLDMFAATLERSQLAELETFKDEITALPPGMAFIWWPERRLFQKVQIRERKTFHAGATPTFERTERVSEARPDVEKLRALFFVEKLEEFAAASPDAAATWREKAERAENRLAANRAAWTEELTKAKDQVDALKKEIRAERAKATDDRDLLDDIRTVLARLGVVGRNPEIEAPILNSKAVEALVREAIAKLPATNGSKPVYLPAPEAIRKDYQQRAIERVKTKLDNLTADEREALRFLVGQTNFVTANRVSLGISGNDAGNTRERWNRALSALVAAELVIRGGSGRAGFKENIRGFVRSALAAHSPSDSEIEETFLGVAAMVAGSKE